MAVGKLTPLGDPAPNAPKWFAAVEIIQLATDKDWRNKRERRQTLELSLRPAKPIHHLITQKRENHSGSFPNSK
jgi:hypothetical protein